MELSLVTSSWGQLTAAFAAGLATLLTPCIYPLLPITISLIGVTGNVSRLRAFLLSASYVLGIALMYTGLGLFAGKTGALFGSFLGSPVVVSILVVFMAILALFSLEVITLPGVSRLQQRASIIGGRGYTGAFLAGAVSGLVAAPCAGPILLGILTLAANSQSSSWGGVLLFVYALGFGSLFLLMGTFSHLLQKLPKPGVWMGSIKVICAAGLIFVALFVAQPFLPSLFVDVAATVGTSVLIVGAVVALVLGQVAWNRESKLGKVNAAAVVGVLVFSGVVVAPSHSLKSSDWLTSLERALPQATRNDNLIVMDIYADWCAACKELDQVTFSDDRVKTALEKFTKVRLNFSVVGEKEQALLDKYQVLGLPSVLILRSDGTELTDLRVVEFIPPEEFLTVLEKAK